MEKIKNVIEKGVYKSNVEKQVRFKAKCNSTEFATAFLGYFSFPFIVDELNTGVINQLFYYLNKSENFQGNPEKGIMLVGSIGSGKTVIMDSFISVIEIYGRRIIEKIQAGDITKIIADGNDHYNKRPIYIDDLGKEPLEFVHYGSVLRPFEDFLDIRYRNSAITFATSNLSLDDMKYNKHTKDRIVEMFNILVLPGKSRRV